MEIRPKYYKVLAGAIAGLIAWAAMEFFGLDVPEAELVVLQSALLMFYFKREHFSIEQGGQQWDTGPQPPSRKESRSSR